MILICSVCSGKWLTTSPVKKKDQKQIVATAVLTTNWTSLSADLESWEKMLLAAKASQLQLGLRCRHMYTHAYVYAHTPVLNFENYFP